MQAGLRNCGWVKLRPMCVDSYVMNTDDIGEMVNTIPRRILNLLEVKMASIMLLFGPSIHYP